MSKNMKEKRIGELNYNNQGCLMKIIDYKNSLNITVEFQDKYKMIVKATYYDFIHGRIGNSYYPSVYGIGILGQKYKMSIDGKITKEYNAWHGMLARCYDEKHRDNNPSYIDCEVCNEWLLFENFYEWLHSQENFDRWYESSLWNIDKDILVKNNKIYSPNTCCLVPHNVNKLFTKRGKDRGDYKIGVTFHSRNNIFEVFCNDGNGKIKYLGSYNNEEEAFDIYKKYKENLIKNIAQIEYKNGNIIKPCYKAMMSYTVDKCD